MTASRLTTADNPYNPFDQYDQWFEFDRNAGYNTPGYLARIVTSSSELPESMQDAAIEDAIDEILELNVTGNYKRVPPQASSTFEDDATD